MNLLHGDTDKLRRYDVVLFLLNQTDEKGWRDLTRIEIQKAVYLVQVIAPLYRIIEDFVKYRSYYNGPYSADVQNSADHLVAAGFVTVTSFRAVGKNVKSSYKITENGKDAVQRLIKAPSLRKLFNITSIVINLVEIYGLENIVNVVYQEPTYKEMRINNIKNKMIPIGVHSQNKTVQFVNQLMEIGLKEFNYKKLTVESILVSYFEYLFESYRIEFEGLY